MTRTVKAAVALVALLPACGETSSNNDVGREVHLTWSESRPHVFEIDGVALGDGVALRQYLIRNAASLARVVVHFPEGKAVESVQYSPPYLHTGFANICHERLIEVLCFSAKGSQLVCHQVTMVNCTGLEDGEEERRVGYFLDGQYVGNGSEGIRVIREKACESDSFVQLLVPWKEGPQGIDRSMPVAWYDLKAYLNANGIRVEHSEERDLGPLQIHPTRRK